MITFQDRIQIETGATTNNRQLLALVDSCDRFIAVTLKLKQVVFTAGLGDINQVVGNLSVFAQIFTGPQIHPAVDLTGISRDDFTTEMASCCHCQGSLPAGSRA